MFRRFRLTPMVMTMAAGTALAEIPEGTLPVENPRAETRSGTNLEGMPGELGSDGVYTVKKGDTLWDLSQSFLNNPWYWPKIWADNPDVENPHWIYPGNRLKIRQNVEGAPGEVTPEDEYDPGFNAQNSIPVKKPEIADFSVGTLKPENHSGEQELTGEITPYRLPDYLRVRVQTLVTDRELAETGVITGSFERKAMLATYDKVYVSFEKPDEIKVGGVYSIFRPRDEVKHPITRERFGFHTELLGSLRVISKNGKMAVAEIGPVTDDVGRGDRVTIGAALEKTVRRTPNKKNVKGIVLATETAKLTTIAENHVVFIDKGSKDGVEDGNTFNVVHSGDGLQKLNLPGELVTYDEEMPGELVATLLVFNVRENSSAAMVMKSLREVNVGDPVEMRVSPTKADGSGGEVR